MMQRFVPALTAAAMVLAACGSSDADSSPDAVLPDVVDAPTGLAAAFAQTATATSFRATTATGLDLDLGLLGQTLAVEADLDNPTSVFEVDSDGEQFVRIDPAPVLDGLLGGLGGTADGAADGGGTEMWRVGSTLIVDPGDLGSIMAQRPEAADEASGDLAEPFMVDLDRLGAGIEIPELATQVGGQGVIDPVELAEELSDAFAESSEQDGDTYTTTLDFSDYVAISGQSLDDLLGGLDLSFGDVRGAGDVGDVDALADLLDELVVAVEVTLADGAVDIIRFDTDLSPMLQALPDLLQAAGGDVDGLGDVGGLGDLGALFAEAMFDVTMLVDFDIDPSIDVVVPTGDFPDLTDRFIAAFLDE